MQSLLSLPSFSPFLERYLGETPEWEFIARDDEHLLPFKVHRDRLSKQRASMAHMNPKRTGVLLDFGTGTSFASFAELWNYLRHNGWATLPGKGLASWHYFPPGSDPKMRHPVLRRDFFDSEDAVIDHVRRTGLERPAPVGTVIGRSSPGSTSRPGSTRVSDARRSPPPTAPTQADPGKPASGKRKPSSRSGAAVAPTPPPPSRSPAPQETTAAAAAAAAIAASAPSPAAPPSKSVTDGGGGGGAITGSTTTNGTVAAAAARNAGGAADGRHGGGGDGAAEPDDVGGVEEWSGSGNISSDDDSLVVMDKKEEDGEKGEGAVPSGGGEARRGRPQQGGRDTEPSAVGGKRSHGKTMQVEAALVSPPRGSAPNLTRQVMRQAVTARRLAKSPPAPSPSKRPKRAAPQVAPKELVRLANKQLKTVRGILDGTERPFPGPCGVERPVADVVKFVKKAHNAWLAQLQQRNNVAALQGMIGAGAIVLAGPRGSGKSTAFQAAAAGEMRMDAGWCCPVPPSRAVVVLFPPFFKARHGTTREG
ncbi:hypothetical protein Esi_0292_0015 [Ectocarpus siliculosus]|uniref:Uncharacterized protein n=1 Tax=Ectocarpus siliculosus TaxID=2880 RepID=D8LKB1_ECTSI|nr:hypothetical protein Esi_0292_0015 [Ectocarpus siliculosus]|eukprot:CBN76056.1 hypothetical protein Esi_0292_0015 [Ectocarpus siliculosus]